MTRKFLISSCDTTWPVDTPPGQDRLPLVRPLSPPCLSLSPRDHARDSRWSVGRDEDEDPRPPTSEDPAAAIHPLLHRRLIIVAYPSLIHTGIGGRRRVGCQALFSF